MSRLLCRFLEELDQLERNQRKRFNPYSPYEHERLLRVTRPRKRILNSKKNNSKVNRAKAKAWTEIEEEYNKDLNLEFGSHRNLTSLKTKYKRLMRYMCSSSEDDDDEPPKKKLKSTLENNRLETKILPTPAEKKTEPKYTDEELIMQYLRHSIFEPDDVQLSQESDKDNYDVKDKEGENLETSCGKIAQNVNTTELDSKCMLQIFQSDDEDEDCVDLSVNYMCEVIILENTFEKKNKENILDKQFEELFKDKSEENMKNTNEQSDDKRIEEIFKVETNNSNEQSKPFETKCEKNPGIQTSGDINKRMEEIFKVKTNNINEQSKPFETKCEKYPGIQTGDINKRMEEIFKVKTNNINKQSKPFETKCEKYSVIQTAGDINKRMEEIFKVKTNNINEQSKHSPVINFHSKRQVQKTIRNFWK